MNDVAENPGTAKKDRNFPLGKIFTYLISLLLVIFLFAFLYSDTLPGGNGGDGIGGGEGTGKGNGTGLGIGDGTGSGEGGGHGSGIGKGTGNGEGENDAQGDGNSLSGDSEGEPNTQLESTDTEEIGDGRALSEDQTGEGVAQGPVAPEVSEDDSEDDAGMELARLSDEKWSPNKIKIGKKTEKKKVASKTRRKPGRTTGRIGSGGGGGGGGKKQRTETIGKMKIVGDKLGVLLDISGSMTSFLASLRQEINDKYKDADYYEVIGCSLTGLAGGGELGLKRKDIDLGPKIDLNGPMNKPKTKAKTAIKINSSLQAMVQLVQKGNDAVYWFCDLQDTQQPQALESLKKALKTHKARLYIRSVGQMASPALQEIIEDIDHPSVHHARRELSTLGLQIDEKMDNIGGYLDTIKDVENEFIQKKKELLKEFEKDKKDIDDKYGSRKVDMMSYSSEEAEKDKKEYDKKIKEIKDKARDKIAFAESESKEEKEAILKEVRDIGCDLGPQKSSLQKLKNKFKMVAFTREVEALQRKINQAEEYLKKNNKVKTKTDKK